MAKSSDSNERSLSERTTRRLATEGLAETHGEPETERTLVFDAATDPELDSVSLAPTVVREPDEDSNETRPLEVKDVQAGEAPNVEAAPSVIGLKPGDKFLDKYEILRVLGAGGMGCVFLARHMGLDSLCAIKVMHVEHLQDKSAIERFKREARACAQVEHPNAVRVFDCGEQAGNCYLVMEYLHGEGLKERLYRRGKIPLAETLAFATSVFDVLGVMHRKRIIHRDLKPDNIVFRQQGEAEVVKVLDFGIAKLTETTQIGQDVTRTGTIMGTPMYMPPEQCQGQEVDGRADIYAMGVILYQMLSGRLPFVSDNMLTLMYLHVNQPAPVLHEVAADVPRAISDVIMRMLAKKPADRYQTAFDCTKALAEAAGTPFPQTGPLPDFMKDAPYTPPAMPALEKTIAREKPPVLERLSVAPVQSAPRRFNARRIMLATVGVATVVSLVVLAIWLRSPDRPTTVAAPPTSAPTPSQAPSNPIANLVLIPGGRATIGRDLGDCVGQENGCVVKDYEAPAHEVQLEPYYLSKYEVTNGEYEEFIRATGRVAPKGWRGAAYPVGTQNHPVTNVSWNDATAYAVWLSAKTGVSFRLPTEDEWEYAARGPENRLYPWGDFFNEAQANSVTKRARGSQTSIYDAPNNTKDVSPFGIFAMGGNVSEWTASDMRLYPKSRSSVPIPPGAKVLRGGSYNTEPETLQTHARFMDDPALFKQSDVGFRLAATPPLP